MSLTSGGNNDAKVNTLKFRRKNARSQTDDVHTMHPTKGASHGVVLNPEH